MAIHTELDPSPAESDSLAPERLYPEWWGAIPQMGPKSSCKDVGYCGSCHPNNLEIDSRHAFSCVTCHKGNSQAAEKEQAHIGLVSDPGDLNYVDQTCGKCHPSQARNVRVSSMALAPSLINHTRFAFGAQDTSVPLFGVRGVAGLALIPMPDNLGLFREMISSKASEESRISQDKKSVMKNLGDDLLRRSCLRCHLYTKGSGRVGEQRGKGCSACHVPYSNSDSKRPYEHVITKTPSMTACLKCHNSNHIGCDYVGLFEKDFNRGFRSPILGGRQAPTIYGSEQHRLRSDTHFRGGMICSDCHPSDQIHGSGSIIESDKDRKSLSCESCHVDSSHPLISKTDTGEVVLKRTQDKRVPLLRTEILPHSVDQHKKLLKCSSCHAGWSFQDYGYHLMLDERAEYWMWSINAAQNDPQIQELLKKFVGDYAELVPPRDNAKLPLPENDWTLPETKDWISGQVRPGAWFKGFTMRRWSSPPLGLDGSGKVSAMRPMRQYVISWVKSDGAVMLDSAIPTTGSGKPALIMNPYSPHTIQEKGRQCHDCHGNPKALGLGESLIGFQRFSVQPILNPETRISGLNFRWDAMLDEQGNPTQSSSYNGAGPLGPELFKRLLFPTSRFRSVWSEYLKRAE
ncbi:MAG: hypothetical protein NTY51_12515 [Deltaproteobacteria bacterium]|nr:hypothetical protein [Deltaproteobacteria bacterium]